ncbi:MAG TPA: hypothetical protein EYH39_02745 [Desulfurobacteriaceae bacterium]|nr:hypothetical protein [Desulfurobacteriaceae bacterium]
MINITNLQADKVFLIFIVLGAFFLILGTSFYILYIKPKQDRKRREQKANQRKKEVDERIKKNQKYWKEVADYLNFLEKKDKD